ncbi:hypothetical protein K443DRAFT_104126, partial [Laccaria amethystina LaAM-08-1]
SWTRLDTYTLREDAPKIRLRNGYALVELCEVLFLTFYPYPHQLSSTYPGSFCMFRGSFRHLHTP